MPIWFSIHLLKVNQVTSNIWQLGIRNETIINICVLVFVLTCLQFMFLSVIAGKKSKLEFSFVRYHQQSSKEAVPLCVPTSDKWEVLLSHPLDCVGVVSASSWGHRRVFMRTECSVEGKVVSLRPDPQRCSASHGGCDNFSVLFLSGPCPSAHFNPLLFKIQLWVFNLFHLLSESLS